MVSVSQDHQRISRECNIRTAEMESAWLAKSASSFTLFSVGVSCFAGAGSPSNFDKESETDPSEGPVVLAAGAALVDLSLATESLKA